ncbi:MAG: hypothetical protein ACREQZ_09945 [Woeseiaceae bacterium]
MPKLNDKLLSAVAAGLLIRPPVFDVIHRPCAGAKVKIRSALIIGSVSGSIAALTLASAAMGQNPFPEAPGRDTVFLACSQCHAIGKIAGADLAADDWQFVVYDMIARGAPVQDDDVDTVIRYLQDNFASDRR